MMPAIFEEHVPSIQFCSAFAVPHDKCVTFDVDIDRVGWHDCFTFGRGPIEDARRSSGISIAWALPATNSVAFLTLRAPVPWSRPPRWAPNE
jgi:hypothetical protein